MAGGNMGDLWFSLDIKDKVGSKLKSVAESLGDTKKQVGQLQKNISEAGAALGKLEKGSNAWKKQKAEVEEMFRNVSKLIDNIGSYERALGALHRISKRVGEGGLLGPHRTILSRIDTKPLEEQITKYERIANLQKEIQNYQARIKDVRARTVDKVGGFGMENYLETTKRLRERLSSATAELNGLGATNITLEQTKAQLSSLYAELVRFSSANERAANYTINAREEEQRRTKAIKDARIAFEPLVAAQARAAAQERANKANIEATNRARQKQVQTLREQSEAMMRNHIAALQSQKTSLGKLYSQGKAIGLDPAELQTILNRYREIAQQLLNMRSIMQNPGGIGYRDMFSMGRFPGAGANYVREASQQVSGLRQRTQEAAMAARSLASEFDRVHKSASKSSRVLSDIKSLFLQGGLVFGAQQLFNELVRTGGEIVQQHVALQTIVGDLQDANRLFGQVQNLALRSPFTFGELNRDVKQLAAFGVETENLYDMTRRLADISSGLGVSFERLGLAYGQVKARSWLDGKELRQFAYAGLPMLEKLADYYSRTRGGAYTTSQVRTMVTKREVSFEDVDAVLKELTNEGGQFFNIQDQLSQTLLGRYMKLKDAWDIMISRFADGQTLTGKFFSFAIDRVTDLVLAFDKLGPVIAAAFSGYAAKRLLTSFGGRAAMDIVAAKQSLAVKLQEKALTQQLTADEMRILQTKHKITAEDLKNQSILRQITQQEVRRLFITGQISKEQYKQLMASGMLAANTRKTSLMFQNAGNWGDRIKATFGLIKGGVKDLGKSLFSMMGGIPGLLITGVSMGVFYLWQQHEELVQAQKRAQEELANRGKQMTDFLKDYNVNDIIIKGSDSVDYAIEAYKDKLKELAPYNYDTYVMTANEKKSHEERLKYLAEQLELLKQANRLASDNASGFVAETKGAFEKALKILRSKTTANGTFTASLADPLAASLANPLGIKPFERDNNKELDGYLRDIADYIAEKLPNVGKDPKVTEAAKMAIANMTAQISSSPQEDMYFRVKLGELLHFPGNENALADEARTRLQKLIQTVKITMSDGVVETGEQLAYKIRYGQKLSKAEEDKLSQLYDQALAQLRNDFPSYANELQSLLNNANFRADIRLNFIGGEAPSEYERQVMDHVPAMSSSNIRRKVAEWAKLGSYEGNNKAKSEIDLAYNKMVADREKVKNGTITSSVAKASEQEYNDLLSAASFFGYDYLGEKKKSNKPDKSAESARNKAIAAARKADQENEKRLKARLRLISDAYGTYKKYYKLLHNEQEAAGIVSAQYKDKGLSNDDVAKITSTRGYAQLIDDYIQMARSMKYRRAEEMKERKDEAIAEGVKARNELNYDLLNEGMSDFASSTTQALDDMSRKWESYQSVWKATGDIETAARASGISGDANAYAGGAIARRYSDYLRNYLDSLAAESEKVIDYDSMSGMSDKEIEKYAGQLFGSDAADKIEGFANAFKKLKDIVTNTEFKEGIDAYSKLLDQIVTQAAEQSRAEREYDDTIKSLESLRSSGSITEDQFNRAKGIAGVRRATKNLQAEDAYKQFMERVASMTEAGAKVMYERALGDLNAQYNAGLITLKQYTDEVTKLNEQMRAFNNKRSDTFSFLTGGLSGLFNNMVKNGQESGDTEKVRKGQKGLDTINYIDAIVNGINANVQSYKKLEDTWTETFGDGLKDSNFSDFMSGFSEASQGAADAFNSLKNGDIVGTIEGTVRTFTGWFSWGNAAANRRYEKQAEYYKKFLSAMQDINASLEQRVSSSYGSQSIEAARKLVSNYGAEATEARRTYGDWAQAHTIKKNHRNRMYVFGGKGETKGYFSQINELLRESGYTGADVSGDTIQNLDVKWLKIIKEDMPEAWAHMNDEAREYLNAIIEMEDETGKLKEANDKLNEVLTGMSFDGLRQEYSSLLNDLDSSNEDFADSFEKHMREAILNGMLSNLYKERLEAAIQDIADLGKNEAYVDKNGNVKMHVNKDRNGNLTYDEKDIASEYTSSEYLSGQELMNAITEDIRGTRDILRDLYGWTDKGSSSMSSSIQGMTEQTGELLAAYLNAIRADVSVIRQLDGVYWPKLDVTVTAQLQQLNMISANTLRNADAADRIADSVSSLYDLLNRSTNGTKQIGVKVY